VVVFNLCSSKVRIYLKAKKEEKMHKNDIKNIKKGWITVSNRITVSNLFSPSFYLFLPVFFSNFR